MKVTALLSLALVSQVKSEFDLTKTVKIATNEAQLVKTCFLQMSRNSNKVDLPAEDQAKFELWGEFYSQFIDNLIVDSAPVAILQKLAKFVYLEDFNDSKPYFEACKNLRVDYSGNHLLNDFIPKTSELEARKGSLWAMVFSLHPISDYACWCHFGKKAGQGAGNAQNMVDQICQNLQLCYRCIKHDHGDPMHTSLLDALSNTNYAPDANGTAIITPVCDPWKTDYLVEMSHGVSDTTVSGIVNMCSINNPNTCKFSVCACEMKMLTEFWNKVTLSNSVYPPP